MRPPDDRPVDLRLTDWSEEENDAQTRELALTSLPGIVPRRLEGSLLSQYATEVKQRLTLRSQERIIRQSHAILRAEIEQVKLMSEYKSAIDAHQRLPYEQRLKLEEMEFKRQELEQQRQASKRLSPLRTEAEELSLRVQIAKQKNELDQLANPAEATPPRLSPGQQRMMKRLEIEDERRHLAGRKQEAMRSASTDEERMQLENLYDQRDQELLDELRRYL